MARAIEEEILLTTKPTASAGVSFNMFLAKATSGMKKPDGLTVILPEEANDLLASLPVECFQGIGR